jgi:hypothetical protein
MDGPLVMMRDVDDSSIVAEYLHLGTVAVINLGLWPLSCLFAKFLNRWVIVMLLVESFYAVAPGSGLGITSGQCGAEHLIAYGGNDRDVRN